MALTQIEVKIETKASKQAVWALLADYGNIHKYTSGVVASHLTTPGKQGLGMTRRCDLPGKPGSNYVVEKIVEWRDGDSFAFVITDTNAPIKDAKVRWTAREHGNKSEIIVQARYRPKLGILGALMNVLIIKGQLGKNLAAILNDMKIVLEKREGLVKAA